MRKCRAVPYEGDENYIFFSYTHEDADIAYPVIELLYDSGYRIWYDEGINAGDEWPEIIAEHLEKAAVFISYVSAKSQESHNCRREFNFAVQENMRNVCVLTEDIRLTPAMRMQMASIQAIKKYELDDTEFSSLLSDLEIIKSCLGSVPVKSKKAQTVEDKSAVKQAGPVPEKLAEPRPEKSSGPVPGEVRTDSAMAKDEPSTVIYRRDRKSYELVSAKNGEIIKLDKPVFKIGRKSELCDYVIKDNVGISRVHAIFTVGVEGVRVTDNNSLNGVYINDKPITPGAEVILKDGDTVDLCEEIFTFRTKQM